MKNYTCCFIGHRKININNRLENELTELIETLILNKKVYRFLFGSKSQFNDFCYKIVSNLKEKYPNIQRIYVRGEYQYISDEIKNKYFSEGYEDNFLPEKIRYAGKASYVERNQEMINQSDFCIFYYNKFYLREHAGKIFKSGTEFAFNYAKSKNKKIYNLYNEKTTT